jgi:hypothetical protein
MGLSLLMCRFGQLVRTGAGDLSVHIIISSSESGTIATYTANFDDDGISRFVIMKRAMSLINIIRN